MARTLQQILDEITNRIQTDPEVAPFIDVNTPSKVAEWKLWRYIVAVSIYLHEQLWDILKGELELIALRAVPGTAAWLQRQVLLFQYSLTTPQVVVLVDGYPTYNPILTELRIVKRCSVKQQIDRLVIVKVAKQDSMGNLIPLVMTELNSLKGYVAKIQFAGTKINVISLVSDKLYIQADIYYDGEYVDSVVKTNVILAVENYLATLSFDGVLSNSGLEDAMQSVAGVKDVVLRQVIARPDTTAITDPGTIKLIFPNYTEVKKDYETAAGYVIRENTATYKLEDGTNLNMILAV